MGGPGRRAQLRSSNAGAGDKRRQRQAAAKSAYPPPTWILLPLCLCLLSSHIHPCHGDLRLAQPNAQTSPQRLQRSLRLGLQPRLHAPHEAYESHDIHTRSGLRSLRKLQDLRKPQPQAVPSPSQEEPPPEEASPADEEASYAASTQYPLAHEKPRASLAAAATLGGSPQHTAHASAEPQNSNNIQGGTGPHTSETTAESQDSDVIMGETSLQTSQTAAELESSGTRQSWASRWAARAMEALFGRKDAEAAAAKEKKDKRRRRKKRRGGGVKALLPLQGPRPMVPVADLRSGYVVCSQNAGPRCVRSPNGTYQVSSFKDTHGVMYCPLQYFYGYFSVQIKFQKGYTGGINTAFYLIDTTTPTNSDPKHAEIDLEFYGSRNASRIIMATNVFAGGYQNLAQFKMPFDGSKKFHEFIIMWSNSTIIWFADRVPFRVLNRRPGSPWPTRPMQPMISVWDTSAWTPLKARYKNGPVSSWFRNFVSLGCKSNATSPETGCAQANSKAWVWNRNLVVSQLQSYMRRQKKLLIKDWGWDKTRPA